MWQVWLADVVFLASSLAAALSDGGNSRWTGFPGCGVRRGILDRTVGGIKVRAFARMAHLRRDEAAPKMGHPTLREL